MMKNVTTIKQRLVRFVYATGLLSLVLAVALSMSVGGALAANTLATAPGLGAAHSFAVLAALSASSANTTTIWGDLGLSTNLADSRTGPWVVGGEEYFGPESLAFNARAAASGAYGNLAGQDSRGTWSLNPNPEPGVWTAADSPTFTGTLTLSGDYSDVWVFQISDSLTFSGNVVMDGNAQPCNVFWQVSSAATIAGGSNFVGTLIAGGDISVVSGASVSGRMLSLDGAITVDNNSITYPPCTAAPVEEPTEDSTPGPDILPATGGDMAGPRSDIIRFSLGALGLTLILFGVLLSRRTQKADR